MITDLSTKRINNITVTSIYRRYTYKMAAKNCGHETKLRHRHPIYSQRMHHTKNCNAKMPQRVKKKEFVKDKIEFIPRADAMLARYVLLPALITVGRSSMKAAEPMELFMAPMFFNFSYTVV